MDDAATSPLTATLAMARLRLRPIGREDTAFAIRHFTDPVVHRFMLDDEPITSAEQATAIVDFYVATPGTSFNRWVLVRAADGEPLGTCGYHRWSQQHRKAEVGYDLSPAWHGQGYMHEALEAVLRHGVDHQCLHRVEALVAVANTPSAKLLQRLGFAREGLLRASSFSSGRFHDHLLFACLSDHAGV